MFQDLLVQLGPIGNMLLTLLGALLILVIGYIIARIVASIVRRLLERVSIDNRIANALGGEGLNFSVEDVTAKVVFWLLMLFVIVAILEFVQLPAVAAPLQSLLDSVTTVYLPRLFGAAVLLLIAWVIATVLRLLVRKGVQLLKLDERLSKHAALEEGERVSFGESLATAVFWFVFLLFLPAVLNALGIASIAEPINDMFSAAFAYLPNVFGAGIVLLIGWLAARIVRQILVNLLGAVGLDSLGERAGLSGSRSLSNLVGLLIYTFILLLTLVSALQVLNISAISDPAIQMITQILDALPAVFGAALVLVVAYYLGRLVGNLVADLLRGFGFDSIPEKLGLAWSGDRSLSSWVGYIVIIAIMLLAVLSATELLGSVFLSGIVNQVIQFFMQVILALVIIAIGIYLANLARNIVVSAAGANANLLANLARYAIILLALAMGLRQMGIANQIVDLAFGILLASIGVAAALAFGLGSREVAGREVERFVTSLRSGPDDDAAA